MEQQTDRKSLHWSEQVAREAITQKAEPYVLMSGITTSGPLHPGTLCEFLFADAVSNSIRKQAGSCDFLFVADILDAFDSIPEPFRKHAKGLEPHLGKPLAHVPDPEGCHPSFGEHFLAEAERAMEKFGASPSILKASDNYAAGKYDGHAMKYSESKDEVKKIVQQSSGRKEMPGHWHPIMPICGKCGRVATTRVLSYADGEYEYACDQDVKYAKGCGYRGSAKIQDHRYKLLFRLDWAARHQIWGVSVEGASVDHHTRGGTLQTVSAVERKFLGIQPPIFFKFGFLKYKGKKYSKSKGIGHTVAELMEVLPIPVLEYALYRPDLQEDKELVLEEGTLLPLLLDYEHASSLDPSEDLARADRKKAISFSLTKEKPWKAPLQDILINYSLYRDWDKVGQLTGDPEGVSYLAPYIGKWFKRGWVPDKYVFELKGAPYGHEAEVRDFAEKLDPSMSAEDIQSLVYDVAKGNTVAPASLFKALYLALIGKEKGPRLGPFIKIIGVEKVKSLLLGSAKALKG